MQISIPNIEDYRTPFYVYNMHLLEQTLDLAMSEAKKYNFKIHYALKANSNTPILRMFSSKGYGADCVSGNEISAALQNGFKPNEVAFAGVGKTDEEISLAIDNNIFSFNVESIPELEVINEIAIQKGKIANIALRINPNVDANTHKYITTGTEENKFGINVWELQDLIENLACYTNLSLQGLHFHIGSQITDMNVFKSLCIKVNKVQEIFYKNQIIVNHINVGGGLGINYHNPDSELIPDFENYFSIFNSFLELRPQQQLHFELGRSLVAQAGSLISKVLYIKKGAAKQFAIIDASMTDLMRPALYQSYHFIDVLNSTSSSIEKYDIVGPVCESTDVFRKAADLPKVKRGDLISIRSTGAYGQVMSSNYNLRDLAGEIYI